MKKMRIVPALLLTAALAACGGDAQTEERKTLAPDAPAGSVEEMTVGGGEAPARSPLPPQAQVHLDSGNTAFRAKDYPGALAHYQEAARIAPDQAATWFGVSMAAEKVGDQAALDTARARVQALSPTMMGEAHPGGAPGAPPAANP